MIQGQQIIYMGKRIIAIKSNSLKNFLMLQLYREVDLLKESHLQLK